MEILPALVAATLFAATSVSWSAQDVSEFQKHAAVFNLKCAKCHTIGQGDRVGPDLRGVASRRENNWILKFILNPDAYLDSDPIAKELRQKYNGVRMENTHLTPAEAQGILEYLKAATEGPAAAGIPKVREETPFYTKLRMPDEGFSVSRPGLAVFLLLLAAGIWFAQGRIISLGYGLILLSLIAGYWSLGGRGYYHLLGNQQGYSPDQPIAFSHAMHAGQLGISCLYCHSGAERSDVAGVPGVNVCMNCHVAVKKLSGATQDSPEIAKMLAVWETHGSSTPLSIEWTRVHRLPDYVHFSHRAHINNKIQCQECHGPVQEMVQMRQAASLSMGWCIKCHREKPNEAPTHWKKAGGPLDCAACHW